MVNDYANHDHAAWMQQHLDFMRKQKPKTYKDAPEKLNEFQKTVFNIIGIVGGGIYNAPISFETIRWDYGSGIAFSWKDEMATFDINKLTALVFLCHEARIRLQIESTGPRRLHLAFWPRKAEGSISVRHPNLDEAVKEFRKWFKPDNSINYKETQGEQEPREAETVA